MGGTLLLLITAVCAAAAVVLLIVLVRYFRRGDAPAEPLPGGSGSYTLTIEGMQSAADAARLAAALREVSGVSRVQADAAAGSVQVYYEGYPGLTLLDDLRRAAERAGFSVKEMQ